MIMNLTYRVLLIATGVALSGCSILSDQYVQSPSKEAEIFRITMIETPSRVVGKREWRSYVIDLAYFLPVSERCDSSVELCGALTEKVLGKDVWVQREYDRYGVPMHTLWYSDPAMEARVRQSINIEMLLEGYVDAPVDARKLPNGKSKLVGYAYESGREAVRLKRIKSRLPEWRLRNIEDADAIERGY